MPSAESVLSTAASLSASAVLIRTIANDLIPRHFQDYLFSTLHTLLHRLSSQFTVIIEEYQGFSPNQLYKAAAVYLGTMNSPSTGSLKVTKSNEENKCKVTTERNEEMVDTFHGIQIKWRLVYHNVERAVFRHPRDLSPAFQSQFSWFQLTFHKKHKDKVMGSYFQHVLSKGKEIKEEFKALKLHAVQQRRFRNSADRWSSVNLEHPATFETLAMDPELKRAVMEDLERFVERRELYRRAGRAWKRGYLLHGPPGTGKSSLIAAMANFLKFDVYDLDLTDVSCNSEFRKLLLATANRSIAVIEDIDCMGDLQSGRGQRGGFRSTRARKDKVTLSGLLNFVDGLWSGCGDERIIIFTTHHKDWLDPALLRPGRLNMHIHMSYLKSDAFNVLASNYLSIDDHNKLLEEIRRLLVEVEVTPAQVAEELMKSDDPDVSLGGLIQYLQGIRRNQGKTGKRNERRARTR